MNTRMILAGLLGGIAMFAWTSVAHMALPLGEAGIREMPNEQAVLQLMQSTFGTQKALYLFPGMGLGPNPTREQQKAAMSNYPQKLATNPAGVLMYNPPGSMGLSPRMFINEFVTELVEALLAVFLLGQTRLEGYAARVGFFAVVGIIAAIATNIAYWNWYGFPGTYTAAYVTTQVVGFLCAGLVAAAVMRTSAAPLRASAMA